MSQCLPTDVRALLRSDTLNQVQTQCTSASTTQNCDENCRKAIADFKAHRCYNHLHLSQHKMPPNAKLALNRHAQNALTLAALQGKWYGLYHAAGIELIEATYDASTRTLTGTKLTGGDYVRAGRVTWEMTTNNCRIVSSLYKNAFTPRWDECNVKVTDRDHFAVTLDDGIGGEEELHFVRGTIPLLLQWQEPRSPTYGVYEAMQRCGIGPVEPKVSLLSALNEMIHHTHGTVVLDQILLLLPLLFMLGVRSRRAPIILVGGVGVFFFFLVLHFRLSYLGIW